MNLGSREIVIKIEIEIGDKVLTLHVADPITQHMIHS